MTKQERDQVKQLEKTVSLLKERVEYLEKRLQYEDPVRKVNPATNQIIF